MDAGFTGIAHFLISKTYLTPIELAAKRHRDEQKLASF
jgi:hypothetical protein